MPTKIKIDAMKCYFKDQYFIPTEKDLKIFFPTLIIRLNKRRSDSYYFILENPENSTRAIILEFSSQQKEIVVNAYSNTSTLDSRKKIIKSYTQLIKVKDLLINYLFNGITKVPQIKKWSNKIY